MRGGRGALVALALVGAAAAASAGPVFDSMAVADHVKLEKSLRWMLARERTPERRLVAPARVAVYADAGAWYVSARSIVDALEADGLACRVLDRSAFPSGLAGVDAFVLPGGWGSLLAETLGRDAAATLRAFVERGGRCVAVSDGGFVLAKTLAWEGKTFDYGFALFDGTAEGPLAALAPWPKRAAVRLAVTEEGKRRGLAALAAHDVLYFGGPRFLGAKPAEVLATYPDGTAAVVARSLGKGEVVLVGVDVERPSPADGDDDAPAPEGLAASIRAFLRLPK